MNNSTNTKPEHEPVPFPTTQDNPTKHEEALDAGLEETFQASDPVSITTKKPDASKLCMTMLVGKVDPHYGTVLVYAARDIAPEHERIVHFARGKRIAGLLGLPFDRTHV